MPDVTSLVASTTAALPASGTWNSAPPVIVTGSATTLMGTVFADVAGTLFIDQGPDGTHWDLTSSFPVSAGVGLGFSVNVVAPNARIRYVNGTTAQVAFRLYAYLPHDSVAYVIQG